MKRRDISAVVDNFKQKQDPIIRKQGEMLSDAAGRQSGFLYIDTHEIDLYDQLIGDELGEFYGPKRRVSRQISRQDDLQLGLHFPCMIKNLSLVTYPNDVTSDAQNLARMALGSPTVDGLNNKFIVSIPKPEAIEATSGMLFDATPDGIERQRMMEQQSYQALAFEIEYGEGCFFDSTRIKARMAPLQRTSCTDDQNHETVCSEFDVCVTKKRVSTRNKEEFIIRSKCMTREKCPESGKWSVSTGGYSYCCCTGSKCNLRNCIV